MKCDRCGRGHKLIKVRVGDAIHHIWACVNKRCPLYYRRALE